MLLYQDGSAGQVQFSHMLAENTSMHYLGLCGSVRHRRVNLVVSFIIMIHAFRQRFTLLVSHWMGTHNEGEDLMQNAPGFVVET